MRRNASHEIYREAPVASQNGKPNEKLGVKVELSLRFGNIFGFTLPEKVLLHGYKGVAGDNSAHLERQVLMSADAALERRLDLIIAIGTRLSAIFPNKIPHMRRWLLVKHPELDGKSVKEM